MKQDKAYNLQLLQDEYQIGPAQIDALHNYAKFQFECGNYSAASEFLYHFRQGPELAGFSMLISTVSMVFSPNVVPCHSLVPSASQTSKALSPLMIRCFLAGAGNLHSKHTIDYPQTHAVHRTLATNSERNLSALWGKLAAEILLQNWEVALDDLMKLKDIVDANTFAPVLTQLQQRAWLMHWSLFVFFNHENGRNAIIDLFFQERCAQTVDA